MTLNTQLITNIESLQTYLDEWRRLAAGDPFSQPDWLLGWWQQYHGDTHELCVLIVQDDSHRVRGIAPWYRDKATKTIRFLGDGEYGVHASRLIVDGRYYDRSVVESMAKFVLELSRSEAPWRQLHLEAVQACDHNMLAFREAMIAGGSKLHVCGRSSDSQVAIGGGWKDFVDGLSQEANQSLSAQVSNLEKTRVRWVHDRADLEDFLPILLEMQKKYPIAGVPRPMTDQRFEKLVHDISMLWLGQRRLHAFTLWIGQRPMAACLCVQSEDRWYALQTGIDHELIEHDPAQLANIVMLREAERFHVKHVMFLRCSEPAMPQLRGNASQRLDIKFLQPSLRGRFQHWWLEICASNKAIVNRMRGR